MAVKLRMKKFGRKNRPEFRIVAADVRAPRDGAIIENLGYYHPLEQEAEKVLTMNEDRVKYWLSVGAQPSETLISILKKRGIKLPWIENAKVKRAKEAAERRTKKGKGPKGPRKPRPTGAAPKKEKAAGNGAAAIDEKAKAAKSKAAKREARKAR